MVVPNECRINNRATFYIENAIQNYPLGTKLEINYDKSKLEKYQCMTPSYASMYAIRGYKLLEISYILIGILCAVIIYIFAIPQKYHYILRCEESSHDNEPNNNTSHDNTSRDNTSHDIEQTTSYKCIYYDSKCSICLNEFNSTINTIDANATAMLKCGHMFHRACIEKAHKHNKSCPLCNT